MMIGIRAHVMLGAAFFAAATLATAGPRSATRGPVTISFGQTISGELVNTAPPCSAEVPNGRTYSFTAEAGTRIEITMHADDFDTLLEIGKMQDCQFVSLGSNDDGGGSEDGLNSRLTGRIPEAGTYIIRATALGTTGAGPFRLTLNRLPPLRSAPEPIELVLGQSVEGKLGTEDAIIEEANLGSFESDGDVLDAATAPEQIITETGRPYHLYSLSGNAGDEYLIKMDSEEFDSFLEVGVYSPLGFSVAQSNDDGPGPDDGLNSRLTIKFQSAGTLIVRVSPLNSNIGNYTLVVEPAPAPGSDNAAPATQAAPAEAAPAPPAEAAPEPPAAL